MPNPRIRRQIEIPLADGASHFFTFEGLRDGAEHLALGFGEWRAEAPLLRVHSECLTGDLFGSALCDCGPQLSEARARLRAEGGLLFYLRQEGRGIGLYNKLDAYALQREGRDTFAANRELGWADDLRDFAVAAEMLQALEINKVRLLSNNPHKAARLRDCGIEVLAVLRTGAFVTEQNRQYLRAKATLKSHDIDWEG